MKNIIDPLLKGKPKSSAAHILREFLQIHILYNISKSKYSRNLAFLGGTALRILYNTARYSQDLDFDLYQLRPEEFTFNNLLKNIHFYFTRQNIDCTFSYQEKPPVYKAFIKFKKLLYTYKLTPHPQQILSIKLEIDINPNSKSTIQTSIINKYNLIFPLLRSDLSSMMSEKICALFKRRYQLGRDIYDLGWYLSKKIEPNYDYLSNELKIKNKEQLIDVLTNFIKKTNLTKSISDVRPFLIKEDGLFFLSHFRNLLEDY